MNFELFPLRNVNNEFHFISVGIVKTLFQCASVDIIQIVAGSCRIWPCGIAHRLFTLAIIHYRYTIPLSLVRSFLAWTETPHGAQIAVNQCYRSAVPLLHTPTHPGDVPNYSLSLSLVAPSTNSDIMIYQLSMATESQLLPVQNANRDHNYWPSSGNTHANYWTIISQQLLISLMPSSLTKDDMHIPR